MEKSTNHFAWKNWDFTRGKWPIILVLIVTLVLIWLGMYTKSKQPIRLVVYAFSTMEEALIEGIFPVFEQVWEDQNGRELTINGVFGPSGSLVGQINLGSPADVAIVSNLRHIDWLKMGKMVENDTEPILIASTPIVIITREGNPSGISNFTDLGKTGLQIIHADPTSSGVGEWAILAEYGSVYLETGERIRAENQLNKIWKNVPLMGASARTTLTLFNAGTCDVTVTYEQDALLATSQESNIEIIIPPRTIIARHFAVVIDKNLSSTKKSAAQDLLSFMLSEKGQQILSEYFFRPVGYTSESHPNILYSFTEDDLGGWNQAYEYLIDDYWKNEIQQNFQIETIGIYEGVGE